MSTPTDSTFVRVEKGQASDEELAALTAVLLARAAATGQDTEDYVKPRSVAGWRRLERQSGFAAPHSWRS
ncbi:acyl-CoA carboxylase epsilon subunit [Actinacidiphila soli]|uniref:acyl-CoA carboxylase epsilon subunit n=1 Tax=Actinacidiphila soli TaxID=2487275 RepID=UPI000FCAAA92|nr:acyl-CoA carboxylase epsilon subunit [Actinacidiphila soli]